MSDPSATSSSGLRPALAKLAAESESITVRKLWKTLTVPEREQAIRASIGADEQRLIRMRVGNAIVKAKRYRPQTVAAMNDAKLAAELAPVAVDDAGLLDAFLVDLHFAHRRPMMAAFLDSLGIPHEDGRLTEDVSARAPNAEALRGAADALAAEHPLDEVFTYFLALVLQDRATWGPLAEWMRERAR